MSLRHNQTPSIQPVTLVFLHGRWGTGQQFDKQRDYLQHPLVEEIITPDLPCDIDGPTYDDNADIVSKVLQGKTNVHLWAHSRGGETAVRVALQCPDIIKHLGYLCARLPRAKDQEKPANLAPRLTDAYKEWKMQIGDQLTVDDFDRFRQLMCNRTSEEDARWLFRTLRRQSSADEAPPIPHQPRVPTDVVYGTEDLVRNAAGMQADSRAFIGVEPIPIVADHYPHISERQTLAQIIISRIVSPLDPPKVWAPGEALATATV